MTKKYATSDSRKVQDAAQDEFSALSALIHDRKARWTKQARAIKFDIEFKAIEQERRRVAKDLHDEILPSLSRLTRAIQRPNHNSESDVLVEEIHKTIESIRDFLGELHPVDLEELGLIPALSNICQRYSRRSGRSIVFNEQIEECNLAELQQLCVYRAMQTVLKMFADSENDLLFVTYKRVTKHSIIEVRCVDKLVSSAEWLAPGNHDFNSLECWLAVANAEFQFAAATENTPQCDLIISVPETQPQREDILTLIGQLTQIRLQEFDTILAVAQEEWGNLINRDCSLFEHLAIEAERKSITKEINRVILARLQTIGDLANQLVETNDPMRADISQRLAQIAEVVGEVLSELHPRLLAEAGLIPSIKTLVERFKRASMIETELIPSLSSSQSEIALDLDAKFAIYRATQEALNNVEKHSQATQARVTVKKTADKLTICIEDNGKGFQDSRSTQSRGLKNIQERAAEIGADVVWSRAKTFETGTLVSISLPLQN
ncbi:MAG: hypothetical protein K2Z81_17220 [Cyanobacteria bacterium]|nr:hypothetical protein [Cyanobacteriota bacterium]